MRPTPMAGRRQLPRTAVTTNRAATKSATTVRIALDGITACTSAYDAPSNFAPPDVRIEYRSSQ
ncbi:Uncharacterised protein [Mycobacteroides abscessus]|nr:Uncharacterised protein [Mycobacteroides abscessus]